MKKKSLNNSSHYEDFEQHQTDSISVLGTENKKKETALTLYRNNHWQQLFSIQTNPLYLDISLQNLQQYFKPQPKLIRDIIPIILSFCDAQTLSRASCVSHEWRSIALSNDLWEHLCKCQFNLSANEIKPRPDPTKLLYILTHMRFREACRGTLNTRDGFLTGFSGRSSALPTIPITAFQRL